MSEIIPSYALSKRRREKREAAAKKQQASENFANELQCLPTAEEAILAEKDLAIAEMVGNELCKWYPGRGWQAHSDIQNGIVKIWNAHVTGKFGWVWKMADMHPSTFTRDVQHIGGELLERAGLSRGKFDESEVLEFQKHACPLIQVDMT